MNDVSAGDDPGSLLEGEVTVDIRGLGAAPLGIASAVFGSTALAYNLGRAEQTGGSLDSIRQVPLPGAEVYRGTLHFTLERRGRHRWGAQSLSVDYLMSDQTEFSADEIVISDSLSASGRARWQATPENKRRAGKWVSPAGWRPGFRPEVDLVTFEAPSVEDCEQPGWALTRRLRTALTPAEQRVTCYELRIHVAHPLDATGGSVWSSPIGEVRLAAENGVYRFSGSSPVSELATSTASMPLPPGTPPETVEAIRSMGKLAAITERLLDSGFPEIDLNTPFIWERTYRGELRNNSLMVRETFPILTGATVYETARVGSGPIVDVYRDGRRVTGHTMDAIVGERFNLEGEVEMADGPVTAWRWKIPGDPVERFEVHWSETEVKGIDCDGKNITATVRKAVNGLPDRLEEGERGDRAVSFVWWKEGRYRVVLHATAGGRTEDAEVTFEVAAPEVPLKIDTGEENELSAGIQPDYDDCGKQLPKKQLAVIAGERQGDRGPIPYSILMSHDPLPGTFAGETQYVQLVAEDGRKELSEIAIPPHCFETHHGWALDATYPYSPGPVMSDWPGQPTGRGDGYTLKLDSEMQFHTWLMYRPKKPDADWVPLRIVDWSWHAGMTWNPDRGDHGAYDVDGPTVRITGQRAADRYPEWYTIAWDEWKACGDE